MKRVEQRGYQSTKNSIQDVPSTVTGAYIYYSQIIFTLTVLLTTINYISQMEKLKLTEITQLAGVQQIQ